MGISEYFFDTYAAIEIIKSSPSYEKYADEKIRITFLNLLEIYYITLLQQGDKKAEEVFTRFKEFVIDLTDVIIFDAMKFRLEHKKKSLSYADCLGYTYARKNNLLFLTGDDGFKELLNVEFVK